METRICVHTHICVQTGSRQERGPETGKVKEDGERGVESTADFRGKG